MYYTVFECTHTLTLCRAAIQAGFTAWIPMERFFTQDAKTGKVLPRSRCAMPGYIFIPSKEWRKFRDWAAPRYSVRTITQTSGAGNQTGPEQVRRRKLKKIPLYELKAMDAVLKYEWNCAQARYKSAGDAESEFSYAPLPGDRVAVAYGPFKGLEGTVVASKRQGIRISLGNAFVTMPAAFLRYV